MRRNAFSNAATLTRGKDQNETEVSARTAKSDHRRQETRPHLRQNLLEQFEVHREHVVGSHRVLLGLLLALSRSSGLGLRVAFALLAVLAVGSLRGVRSSGRGSRGRGSRVGSLAVLGVLHLADRNGGRRRGAGRGGARASGASRSGSCGSRARGRGSGVLAVLGGILAVLASLLGLLLLKTLLLGSGSLFTLFLCKRAKR